MRYTPLTNWLCFLLTTFVGLVLFAHYCGHSYSEILEHPNVVLRNLMR